jgi:PAS domain S-box-containing protein
MISENTTVLIVDDRPANRYTAGRALERAGFEVLEADSGQQALELSKKLPSVIIMDVKLPDILGYEVCRRIKANSQTRHIPVLQLSASFVSNESKLYALESGADAYLVRPIDPVVLVATVQALVRLRRAETQAHIAARQWQATFDALSEGVATVDSNGIVQRCNRAMTELLGKSYSEIEGSTLSALLNDRFEITLGSDESRKLSREVRTKDRFFRLSLDPVYYGTEATGSILIVAETTRQKRAEEALLISERLAATGRMAHTIAHEINNPLEAITNLVYLLESSLENTETSQQYIKMASGELERVSRISKQILSFNRESSTAVELSIGDLIDDVLALNNQPVVLKNLRIERSWNKPIFVHGFPAQLRQVFSNLFRNAVEASYPGGTIRIKISPTKYWNTKQSGVRITIADCGIGIPPENMSRIFDAFFTTKDLKGSGVGLWLSSTIINDHGGRLHVRSSTNPAHSGTCMSVLLPCEAQR